MLNTYDLENVVKISQTANISVQDLRESVKSANPLLADFDLKILHPAVQIEQQLNRIESIARQEEKTA